MRIRWTWRSSLYVVAAWLGVGLLSASQYSLAWRTLGQPEKWNLQLLREIPPWQIWSLLTPAVFALADRFPITSRRLVRSLPIHAVAGLVCAMAYFAAYSIWIPIALPGFADTSHREVFVAIFQARLNVALILYAGLVGVHHAISHARQLRAREIEAAEARAESAVLLADAAETRAAFARARLQELQSKLQPHFLFNTLHSIASLADEDPPTARRLIARLSDLLRTTLEVGEATEIRLEEEIGFLERYVDIEQVRYGSRLALTWEIAPETRAALLPPLLLQPLVENAIRHGIAPIEAGGAVRIGSARDGRWLRLEVADTGRGLDGASGAGSGNGLPITRERLQHLYGDEHTMVLEPAGASGLRVEIRIPYHTEARSGE